MEPKTSGALTLLGTMMQLLAWVIIGALIGWRSALVAAAITFGTSFVFAVAQGIERGQRRKAAARQIANVRSMLQGMSTVEHSQPDARGSG